ncbi:MAG: hypothetical protein K2X34_05180 [Hyphomonadaceae bacterium]|nr:hypothetical protein [Hyphomonadaceae bacterium]
MWVTIAWLALVLVHTPPALATFSADMRARMYGVESAGALDVILTHRGVLFLAVAAACMLGAFVPSARPSAALVVSISVIGFLAVYALGGAPTPLRTVALVDAIALAPLAVVLFDVWRRLTATP